MALVLAATGVYGVLSYFVSRRRREMGIRLALGAKPAGLRSMVLRQGLLVGGAGILAGLVFARLGASVLKGLLFGVDNDAISAYAVAALTLLAVTAGAAALPAWRASAVAPAESLRSG